MAYATKTTVPVDRTIGEIRKILDRAGACGFAFAEQGSAAYVIFKFQDRAVKMWIRIPRPPEKSATEATKKGWEQARKSKWRSFLLCIKAKIESIESGIETFDEAFLPHLVLKNGNTVGSQIIHKIAQLNEVPPALLLGL